MVNVKDLEINNILDLQLALLEDNNSAIKGYVERLDRETSNSAMRQAGEHFGFPTVEIEGVVRTSAGHLSRVFGYKTVKGLTNLLERREIYGVKMGGFVQNVQSLIQKELNLDPSDHSAVLLDWPAFLIGGMNSTNEEARIVQTYLLRMERVARVGIVGVRAGQIPDNLPEPVHAMVKCKLAKEAWRGNPIASYILEHDYGIPVSQLLHRTDPGMSEIAGTIVQYFSFILEDKIATYGLKIKQTEHGFAIKGRPEQIYTTFLEMARRHHLHRFFGSIYNLGSILSREADAMEILGWRRSIAGRANGNTVYQYEQCRHVIDIQEELMVETGFKPVSMKPEVK